MSRENKSCEGQEMKYGIAWGVVGNNTYVTIM